MSTTNYSRDQKKQIKQELDALLKSSTNPLLADDDDLIADDHFAEIAAAPPINFAEMNEKFAAQARKITESMLKFYVDLGYIDKYEYIQEKKALDNSSIENILFQLKTIRMAIERIAEEINQGNLTPKLLEVFGQLQDKLSTVIKMQANYMMFLEDTYKKVKQEADAKLLPGQELAALPGKTNAEYFITAGTKNLIKELDDPKNIIEPVEVHSTNLTNPNSKNELMVERGLSNLIITEEPDDLLDSLNEMI